MVQTRKRTLSECENKSEVEAGNVSVAKTPRKTSSTQHVSSPRPSSTTPRRTIRSSEKQEVDKPEPAVGKQSSTPRRSSRRLSRNLETINEDSPLRNVAQSDTPTRTRGRGSRLDLDSKAEVKQTLNLDDIKGKVADGHVSKVTPVKQKNSGSGSIESMGDCLKDGVEIGKRYERRKSIITLDTVDEGEENETEADVEENKSEEPSKTVVDTDCTDIGSAKDEVCENSSEGGNKEVINPEKVSDQTVMECEETMDLSETKTEDVEDTTGNQSESLSSNEKQVQEVIESKSEDNAKPEVSSCVAVVEKSDEKSSSTEGTEVMAEKSDVSSSLEETAEMVREELNAEQSVGFVQEQSGDTSRSDEVEKEKICESEVKEIDAVNGEEKENVSVEKTKSENKVVSESKDSENANLKSDALVKKHGMQNDNANKGKVMDLNGNAKPLVSVNDVPNPVLGQVPRGQPKSGRWWKNEKKRFSSVVKVKPLKTSWAKKMQVKEQRQAILAASAAVKEEKRQKMEQLRERQRINKERREENARKAEVVQLIKDPRKLKKMKRKQLRQIEKRDPSSLGK